MGDNYDELLEQIKSDLQSEPETRDKNDGGVNDPVNKLKRKLSEITDQMKEYRSRLADEEEELTDEELEEFDELHERGKEIKDRIKKLEKTEDFNIDESRDRNVTDDVSVSGNFAPRDSKKYEKIFRKWMANGMKGLRSHERDTLLEARDEEQHQRMVEKADKQEYEERALTTVIHSSGGALIPEQMEDAITEALVTTGPMMEAPTDDFTTETGQTFEVGQFDDTSNKGSIIKEDGSYSKTDPDTSSQKLDSFLYTSDEIELTLKQINDDPRGDLMDRLGQALGKRIARKRNELQTTGQGGNEPRGIVTASVQGTTTSSAGTLSYDDFPDIENSLSQVFFEENMIDGFMFNRNTLQAIKKVTDSNNNPIFFDPRENNIEGRAQVFNYPFWINEDMADIGSGGSGNKFLIFGAFSRYKIRTVDGIEVFRIPPEAKMAADQKRNTGIVGFVEGDADLDDPGDNPVVHLATS